MWLQNIVSACIQISQLPCSIEAINDCNRLGYSTIYGYAATKKYEKKTLHEHQKYCFNDMSLIDAEYNPWEDGDRKGVYSELPLIQPQSWDRAKWSDHWGGCNSG